MSPGQNAFFFELAASLRFEVERLGVRTSLSTTGFPPPERGSVYALLPPHEYFVLEGHRTPVDERLLKRTVFVSAEQPGTPHFEDNVRLSKLGGALFDINAGAVREYALRGVEAQHLQLGYSSSLDHFTEDEDRKYDALFMGCFTPVVGRVLAGCAPFFSQVRSRLIISDNSRPEIRQERSTSCPARRSSNCSETRRRSSTFTNPRSRTSSGRGSSMRFTPDASSSANSQQISGLWSRESISYRAAPNSSACCSKRSSRTPISGRRLRRNAYEFIRSELPLAASAQRLIDTASSLDRSTRIPSSHEDQGGQTASEEDGLDLDELAGIPQAADDFSTVIVPSTAYPATDPESAAIRRVLKEVRLDLIDLRRMATRAVLTGAVEQTDSRRPDRIFNSNVRGSCFGENIDHHSPLQPRH